MITSTNNERVKYLRALQSTSRARRKARAFVVEGVRLAEEAAESGWDIQLALYSQDLNERGRSLVAAFQTAGVEAEECSPHVLKAISDTPSPQGLVLVLGQRELTPPANLDFILILDELRDPGNLGALLRTAAAAGVQAVLLPPGNTDAFAPKVLRSAMGAHFHLPLLKRGWEAIFAICRQNQLQVSLAATGEHRLYTSVDFQRPSALLIGGEARGAGTEALNLADQRVTIPMHPGSESLNAAAAGAILLFEVVRQRRT